MTIDPKNQTERWTALNLVLALLAASAAACSTEDPGPGEVRYPAKRSGSPERVVFDDTGKLSGGMEGYAWVAGADLATIEAPNPCNEHGCFTSTQDGLCTRGSMPALTCTTPESWDCNYEANWGVLVGLNPKSRGEAWGEDAPETVAVAYAGEPGNYRLTAHVAGDPDHKTYCIEGYVSGLPVSADRFRSECWSDDGDPLPSFAVVDMIGLMVISAKHDVSFNYCVSDVSLDVPADTGRVLVGNYGKLSGPMGGYAWVAAGEVATVASPSPCDEHGCFRNAGGVLCTRGSLPALECTGQNTPEYDCNWSANWGAMIGMNPAGGHTAWGERATDRVAFTYSGGPGTYRLTAHVEGDPKSRVYCIPRYQSGQEVTAEMFRTTCWNDSGTPLGSFADVDSFGLMITSAETPVSFDYCISSITAR
jgi:hypothetical protein